MIVFSLCGVIKFYIGSISKKERKTMKALICYIICFIFIAIIVYVCFSKSNNKDNDEDSTNITINIFKLFNFSFTRKTKKSATKHSDDK